MIQDQIEHTEHRRAAADRREPVAWAGRSPHEVATAAEAAPEPEGAAA